MDSATDSALVSRARLILSSLALLAILIQPGCSRLSSFRQAKSDEPAFGTDLVTRDESKPGSPRVAGDLYAQRMRKPADSDTLAEKESNRPDNAELRKGNGDEILSVSHQPPQVALLPPVTVRPLSEESLAENDDRPPLVAPDLVAPIGPIVNPAKGNGPTVKSILSESRRTLDGIGNYQVKMSHQERVGGTLEPAEDLLLSIRRNPKAVRLEWREGPHKGREVLYAADANGGLMHVNMGDSLVPVPRLSMAPDSPLATRNSRHPITEAGFDTIIGNMEESLRLQASGDASEGFVAYDGLEQADGLEKPCHKLRRDTPRGERWLVYIDPENHLPALVQATTNGGELLERYVFRDPVFERPELASKEAFDPDSRWGASKGLLQRFARGVADATAPDTRSR